MYQVFVMTWPKRLLGTRKMMSNIDPEISKDLVI